MCKVKPRENEYAPFQVCSTNNDNPTAHLLLICLVFLYHLKCMELVLLSVVHSLCIIVEYVPPSWLLQSQVTEYVWIVPYFAVSVLHSSYLCLYCVCLSLLLECQWLLVSGGVVSVAMTQFDEVWQLRFRVTGFVSNFPGSVLHCLLSVRHSL